MFFIGHDHGRKAQILAVQALAEKQGLSCDFRISNNDKDWFIPYCQVEEMLQHAHALLEINQVGQTGATLRAMEALFYCKKLVTNNAEIQKQPYYCSDNIFILGTDNNCGLKQFCRSPYNHSVDKYQKMYTISAWFNNFDLPQENKS